MAQYLQQHFRGFFQCLLTAQVSKTYTVLETLASQVKVLMQWRLVGLLVHTKSDQSLVSTSGPYQVNY